VDPLEHRGRPQRAVEHVRNWLNGHAMGTVPGPQAIRVCRRLDVNNYTCCIYYNCTTGNFCCIRCEWNRLSTPRPMLMALSPSA
jgi:hypothetical protein